MKKIVHLRFYLKKILPYSVIVLALVFAGSIAYAFSPKSPSKHISPKKIQSEKAPNHATRTPSPTFGNVLGTNIYNPPSNPIAIVKVSILPTNNLIPTSQPNTQNSITANSKVNNQSTSTVTNTTQTPTATTTPLPTSSPTSAVSLQIQDPAGNSAFTITLKSGANICDVLQEAKDEGKITSLTFNDSYVSTLHSRYVTEIDGFANNWTFTVNGSAPGGCSLSNPKPNDTIVWKFG